MGARLSIRELIETVGGTYRSIDLRTAANRDGNIWLNSITVIRLTYETPEQARGRQQRVVERYPPVATEHFRILLDVRPFSDWATVLGEAARGVVRFTDTEVLLREPIALEELAAEPRADPSGVRMFDGVRWPGVYVSVGSADRTRLLNEVLLREVSRIGYTFPADAINEICELDVSTQNPGQELYIAAPLFVNIADVSLHPAKKRLQATISRHRELASVTAAAAFRGRDFGTGQSSHFRRALAQSSPIAAKFPLETVTAAVSDLPDVEEDSWVEVKLIHPVFGEIQQVTSYSRALVPAVERNALFEALKRFCPEAELKELLVHAYSKKPGKLTEAAAFELHVAWLLGLFRCPTIVLGKYHERLRAANTGVELGSVDVLAVTPDGKKLLLVACTLTTPKEEDFGRLLNVRGILEREVFAQSPVPIQPIVFTSAVGSPGYREFDETCIPAIGGDDMGKLLQLVEYGQEARFFEFLTDPAMWPLPEF